MTQEEIVEQIRSKMQNSLQEVHPLVEQMTILLTQAYEKGLMAGLDIGSKFIKKD